MDIRDATPEDVEGIQRVARLSWHAAYGDVIDPDRIDAILDEWYAPGRLGEAISVEGPFVVADDSEEGPVEGGVVGYAQAVPRDDTAELVRLYVHPDRWGEGIGTRLLASVVERLGGGDARELCAVVMATNEVGLSFYERHGFVRRTRRTTNLPGESFDVVVIVADLTALADLPTGRE